MRQQNTSAYSKGFIPMTVNDANETLLVDLIPVDDQLINPPYTDYNNEIVQLPLFQDNTSNEPIQMNQFHENQENNETKDEKEKLDDSEDEKIELDENNNQDYHQTITVETIEPKPKPNLLKKINTEKLIGMANKARKVSYDSMIKFDDVVSKPIVNFTISFANGVSNSKKWFWYLLKIIKLF